jgi:hypothetical protein
MSDPRIVKAGSLSELLDKLKEHRHFDDEHNAIIRKSSDEILTRLKELSGGNELALCYVTDILTNVMDGLTEKNVNLASEVTPKILRIVADTIEERNRAHKELHERRAAEKTKDMH